MTTTPATDCSVSASMAERIPLRSSRSRVTMLMPYPAARAARSMPSRVAAGPNRMVSKLTTPITRERRPANPRARAFGR